MTIATAHIAARSLLHISHFQSPGKDMEGDEEHSISEKKVLFMLMKLFSKMHIFTSIFFSTKEPVLKFTGQDQAARYVSKKIWELE